MSIVVFNPDNVDDVDFSTGMRHPSLDDPANNMWLSDTEPPAVDAVTLRPRTAHQAQAVDGQGRLWRRFAVRSL